MKRLIASLVSLSVSLTGFAQLSNGDFEAWSNLGLFEEPDGFVTSNTIYLALDILSDTSYGTSVLKSSNAQSGDFSLRIKNVVGMYNSLPADTLPGFVVTGEIDGDEIRAGFPVSNRPLILSGYYQFIQGGVAPDLDTAAILVGLSRYNELTQTTDSVGGGFLLIYESADFFTPFSVDIVYVDDVVVPDTAYVLIASSIAEKVFPKTELAVDAIGLNGITLIGEPVPLSSPKLFPHPVQGEAIISNIPDWVKVVRVRDSFGREVYKEQIHSKEHRLNLTMLTPGLYFYHLENEKADKMLINKFSYNNK
ncbi:MAG TPA: hypothetical protein VIK89_08205 [Cytophagaceae bacterium]